jgi:hypothetical protein
MFAETADTLMPLMPFLASITVVCGAIIAVQKVLSNHKKERDSEAAKVLHEAREMDALMKAELEGKIEALEKSLDNLESNINKDFDHMRETYNGEIRNLGQKIEELRSELRNQHGQLVGLLTKMIENRD